MNVTHRLVVSLWLGLGLGLATTHAVALERPESTNTAQNYLLFCGGCHGDGGHGVPHKVPALNGAIGRFLTVDGGREFLLRVPGVANSQLSDAALTAVMNLCIDKFADSGRGTNFRPYLVAEVTAARRQPLLAVSQARRVLLRRAGVAESELAADY